MTKIVIDAAFQAKLQHLNAELELCDESGRTLGFVLPPDIHHQLMYAWAKAQIDDATVERALSESGGMTTSELLSYLDQLDERGSPSA